MDCDGTYAVDPEVAGNGKGLTHDAADWRGAGVHSNTKRSALPEAAAGYFKIWRWGWLLHLLRPSSSLGSSPPSRDQYQYQPITSASDPSISTYGVGTGTQSKGVFGTYSRSFFLPPFTVGTKTLSAQMFRFLRKAIVVTAVCAAVFLVATKASPHFTRDRSKLPLDFDKVSKGYRATNVRRNGNRLTADLVLNDGGSVIYGPDIRTLKLVVEPETKARLHVKITDAHSTRYEVPEPVFPRPKAHDIYFQHCDLEFRLHEFPFSFSIVRRSSREVLFSTESYPLVFKPQYLRIKTSLPAHANIYGLGEHNEPLRLPVEGNGTVRTLWSRDSYGIPRGTNLYGNYPIYFDHRGSGTHGVFLLNSNGMDIKLNSTTHPVTRKPISTLEYNVIGGVFDFYFFAGPDPIDVAQQYAQVAGLPAMMPYWGFGFHQCRYGYRDWIDVAEVITNYSSAKIPLETMWTDIDYMYERWVFTLDPERFPIDRMRQVVDFLHSRDQRYIMMVDPAVAYKDYPTFNRGVSDDIWLKRPNGTILKGVVWPGVTVYPDWFHLKIEDFWVGEFQRFFNPDAGVDIDGVWIDMNEPANFCRYPCINPEAEAITQGLPPVRLPPRDPPRPIPGFPDTSSSDSELAEVPVFTGVSPRQPEVPPSDSSEIRFPLYHSAGENLTFPPYAIGNAQQSLSDRTVQTDVVHDNGLSEYDTHNIYGHMMSFATHKAMLARRPGKWPLIITRSAFAGAGTQVGKWLGDNLSTWAQYRYQIAGMLNFAAFFQMPMVGSDVCGFSGGATPELCARWATLGAFNPFYRNHNDIDVRPQEFFVWPETVASAKKGIATRYRLLDYLYTAFHRQHSDGTPILNPLFFIYPKDTNTYSIDMQFFYGSHILVSPVTEENSTSVTAYFPDDIFYDFFTHKKFTGQGSNIKITNVSTSDIPLHIRGGVVLPLRLAIDDATGDIAMTTTELRKRDFELIIAPSGDSYACGWLYIDDGESIEQKRCDVTNVEFGYRHGRLWVRGPVSKNPGREIIVRRIVILGVGEVRAGAEGQEGVNIQIDAELQKVVLEKEGGWCLDDGMEIELF